MKRLPYEQAFKAATVHPYDYVTPYVDDLANVVDLEVVRDSGIHLGVDPLGGASVHYWGAIRDNTALTSPW